MSKPQSQLTNTALSSASSQPVQTHIKPTINWTNNDINYLLSCLYPEHTVAQRLILSPRLESLLKTPPPVQIQLLKTPISVNTSLSPSSLTGAGRSTQAALLAASSADCTTPKEARISLARNLLSDYDFVHGLIERYSVLYELFGASNAMLSSLNRGIGAMMEVGEEEWSVRRQQIRGQVDGECCLEARFEHFLLEVGREEVGRWMGTVELIREMEGGQRKEWSAVYENAAMFLERAVEGFDE